jgi:uncharacterized membrane protein YcjF (UPF0283 family)
MEQVLNKAEGPSPANGRWTRAIGPNWPNGGHGIAAKLSQRLGEGMLTARLGLAAIDVTRPLPFTALPRPALADLAKDLLRKRDVDE